MHSMILEAGGQAEQDGVIKFVPILVNRTESWSYWHSELIQITNSLKRKGYIGVYPDGVGHGNVAVLDKDGVIWVTGTQTQGVKPEHFAWRNCARILPGADPFSEEVPYEGMTPPSSESRTLMAMLQLLEPGAGAVHTHFAQGFNEAEARSLDRTPGKFEYGTVGFAKEAQDQVLKRGKPFGIFATPSHEDGIFSFGRSIFEAYKIMVDYCDAVRESRDWKLIPRYYPPRVFSEPGKEIEYPRGYSHWLNLHPGFRALDTASAIIN